LDVATLELCMIVFDFWKYYFNVTNYVQLILLTFDKLDILRCRLFVDKQ
jgi:hypothetical protein